MNILDEVVQVNDGDAILMAQLLGKNVGILFGANLLGAIKVQQTNNSNEVIIVFPDSNKKYLSTDLMSIEPVKLGCLTPDIELIGYRAIDKN